MTYILEYSIILPSSPNHSLHRWYPGCTPFFYGAPSQSRIGNLIEFGCTRFKACEISKTVAP